MNLTRLPNRIRLPLVLSLFTSFVIAGCAGNQPKDSLPLYSVRGTVSVSGKPAEGVLVMIEPAAGSPASEKHLRPSGATDAEGQFFISTYNRADGAPAGAYSVLLQWPQMPTGKGKQLPPGFARPQDQFRGKYMDPAKSIWKITVKESENVLDPIAVN